jgi:hypothetical protein
MEKARVSPKSDGFVLALFFQFQFGCNFYHLILAGATGPDRVLGTAEATRARIIAFKKHASATSKCPRRKFDAFAPRCNGFSSQPWQLL